VKVTYFADFTISVENLDEWSWHSISLYTNALG
jgi:hypothetical protein